RLWRVNHVLIDFMAASRRSPSTRNTTTGISIGHTIKRASHNTEKRFWVVDSLASAITVAPTSTSAIKRNCISESTTPTPNNLTGPILSKIVMNFGGGAS